MKEQITKELPKESQVHLYLNKKYVDIEMVDLFFYCVHRGGEYYTYYKTYPLSPKKTRFQKYPTVRYICNS